MSYRYSAYDDERFEAERQREAQKEKYNQWLKLRETERKLYIAVVKAWRKNKSSGRWNQKDELGDWITREQIADELGSFRLIPYYIRLLDHLADGKSKLGNSRDGLHWIQKGKRTRWRRTYEGRRRPAGYEWVYYPREDVIEALNEMNPNNPKREAARPVPVLPATPEYKLPLWERMIDRMFSWLW